MDPKDENRKAIGITFTCHQAAFDYTLNNILSYLPEPTRKELHFLSNGHHDPFATVAAIAACTLKNAQAIGPQRNVTEMFSMTTRLDKELRHIIDVRFTTPSFGEGSCLIYSFGTKKWTLTLIFTQGVTQSLMTIGQGRHRWDLVFPKEECSSEAG